jgi:hypothetical protein
VNNLWQTAGFESIFGNTLKTLFGFCPYEY